MFNSRLTLFNKLLANDLHAIVIHYTTEANQLSIIIKTVPIILYDLLIAIKSRVQINITKKVLDIDENSLYTAIEYDQIDIVKWLYNLKSVIKYNYKQAIPKCVRYNRLAILKWFYSFDQKELVSAKFHHSSLDAAAQYNHFEILKWINNSDSCNKYKNCTSNAMDWAAKNGNLEMIQWLHTYRRAPLSTFAMDWAAELGHLEVVKWLTLYRSAPCTGDAMYGAAINGHYDTVKWLYFNRTEAISDNVIDDAARAGRLDIIKLLCSESSKVKTKVKISNFAMHCAAGGGHLSTVKWLHENRQEGCTRDTVDIAAQNGHLATVDFLLTNRKEWCTVEAMHNAAAAGHFDIVKCLTKHKVPCTTEAMDLAAQYGHFEIVVWLHHNRKEGCTKYAMDCALINGHLEIAKWLYANRTEGCTQVLERNLAPDIQEWLKTVKLNVDPTAGQTPERCLEDAIMKYFIRDINISIG